MERSHFDQVKIDETRIKKIEWYYDHLGSYKHSFVVMEAHGPLGARLLLVGVRGAGGSGGRCCVSYAVPSTVYTVDCAHPR